jgi:hypothetical protein
MTEAEYIARVAELEREIRLIKIAHHLNHFSNLVSAIEDRKLSLADLTTVVSIERIRAIFKHA